METRKIYMSGGSSYVVSLPKRWVEESGLKSGDSLAIEARGNSLLLEPVLKEFENPSRELRISTISTPEALERQLIAHYLAGYEMIKIVFDVNESVKFREVVRNVMSCLIGVELMEETSEYILLEVLFDNRKMPTIKVLKRMHAICKSMLEDVARAIEDGISIKPEIAYREGEIDKLYFLVVRQLKCALQFHQISSKLGIENTRDCLGYRVIVKNIERIADHVRSVAEVSSELITRGNSLKEYLPIMRKVEHVYNASVEAIIDMDYERLEEVFEMSDALIDELEGYFNSLFSEPSVEIALLKKSILDSLSRVVSYSEGIAEIGVNYSVPMPKI